MCINMIVIAITIASLLSGVLGSYDSLAKCLYEEEVADAQVRDLLFTLLAFMTLYPGHTLEQGQL